MKECPYCQSEMDADFVDVGVGSVQCGPYHCTSCGASEIGPEMGDWFYKDRKGKIIFLPGKKFYSKWDKKKIQFGVYSVLMPGHPFTKEEIKTGFYRSKISPYANTVGGVLVDHQTAKHAYDIGLLDEKRLPETEEF